MNSFSISAGGVCIRNDKVLLVKVGYGSNSGMWMIPGGFVELGESIEEAAIREVSEETGLETEIVRLVCVRSGTQEREDGIQSSLYVIFEVMYKSGILKKDDQEIVEIKYWDIDDVMISNEVIELSKEIIKATWETRNGLYRGNEILTNNKYISYNYYLPNI
ncbi:NUDIX domain-containing protein [Paenibacillus agri]|uniref:NUDIX domain-containing protein n=1 Tax=Paenibacillus agri TaxID=2744309 RepID=A0A850ENH8_9BACL|nr:NUDIX domain-containing protein [Paenibacillus agri]NUU60884.1 NUDIX domain-containing protein [Paenibacillus agri]